MLPGLRQLKSSEALRRSLPLLALIAALLGTWLQPPAAEAFTRNSNALAIDTMDGVERAAVKPKPLAQLQASAKKRLTASAGHTPDPLVATTVGEQQPSIDRLDDDQRLESISSRAPRAIIAQPRAPPFSRT